MDCPSYLLGTLNFLKLRQTVQLEVFIILVESSTKSLQRISRIQGRCSSLRLRMPHDKDSLPIHKFSCHAEFPFILKSNDVPSPLKEIIERTFLSLAENLFNERELESITN